jgi:hypothetical protein
VNLAEQLEIAKRQAEVRKLDAGDERVATELKLDIPKPALAKDVLERLDIFGKWCASKQARKCPAKPKTVAAFVLEQSELGASPQVICSLVRAIEALHWYHGLSNPTATPIVYGALERVVRAIPPRSWNKDERAQWALLPPEIRDAIARRENDRDKELRRLQNKYRQTNGAETKPVIKPNEETKLCLSDAEMTA